MQFISGVDCADVLLITDGEFHSLAATSPTATEQDEVQLRTAEGPCLDAAERDVIVRSHDLRSETRVAEVRAAGGTCWRPQRDVVSSLYGGAAIAEP